MKTNKEIRLESRTILRGRWLWRLLAVGIALQGLAYLVNILLGTLYRELSIVSFGDFMTAKLKAAQAGLLYTLPTTKAMGQMIGGFIFQSFIGYVFAAIFLVGFASVLLKAVADREDRWLADSFGGFARPLGNAWLLLLVNVKTCLWALLFIVPGIVAAYRYRQAWFLRNEHPDWSPSQCLAESGRMMRGYKGRAFMLDLSYLGWIFLAYIGITLSAGLLFVAKGSGAWISLIGGAFGAVMFYFLIKALLALLLGRAILYREMKGESAEM